MGQIINRLIKLAKSRTIDDQGTSSSTDILNSEDEELKRIINELNTEKYSENRNKSSNNNYNQPSGNSGNWTIESALLILKIDSDYSIEKIKESYKQRMKEYHPDRVASLGEEIKILAANKTKEINSAYDFLKRTMNF